MSDSKTFDVRRASWHDDLPMLRQIRETVFIEEQAVPVSEEWDEYDPICQHVLAIDSDGQAIGTGRLTPVGKVGRMAVLADWRGHGVGAAILEALIAWAHELGWRELSLHAQTHAMAFYEHFGFQAQGPEFMEAGIAHREMHARLKPAEVGA